MFGDEFDKLFKRMDNIFESGMPFYGYSLTIGADGKPIFREYGNKALGVQIPQLRGKNTVDEIVTNDEVKYVMEMAGLQKEDIKIHVADDVVTIEGERDQRRYSESIPLRHKVEQPKATYTNGILELVFKRSAPTSYNVTVA